MALLTKKQTATVVNFTMIASILSAALGVDLLEMSYVYQAENKSGVVLFSVLATICVVCIVAVVGEMIKFLSSE